MCVCVCVCVDGAFVTKHPRCQRDTVGWWSKGWGPREEVFLYCCTAVETVAPSLSLSYSRLFSGNLQQAGSRNSEWYFSTRREWRRGGRRGGEEGRGGGALFPHAPLPPPPVGMCSPYEPRRAQHCGLLGGEGRGRRGRRRRWMHTCTLAFSPPGFGPWQICIVCVLWSSLRGSSVDPLSSEHVHLHSLSPLHVSGAL